MRFRSMVVSVLALAVSALYLWGRPRPKVAPVERETEAVLSPAAEPSPLSPPPPIAPPTLSEVQPTLDRVFDHAFAIDRVTQPAFVAGDFNGDDVTDLAVAVRPRTPRAGLDLRAALAHCRLQDAIAPLTVASATLEPRTLGTTDLLLAVVHGAFPGGWRNPDARQCDLVKNAVGAQMRARPLAGTPDAIRMRAIRSHVGDVIAARRGGQPGLLFWTGATYVWADRALDFVSAARGPAPGGSAR